MFGVSPGCFKNLEAVELAAKSFSLEEGTPYVVYFKVLDDQTWYRPGMVRDEEVFLTHGYKKYSM